MSHILIIGAGFSACYCAHLYADAGFEVTVTTRNSTMSSGQPYDFPKQTTFLQTDYSQPFIPDGCSHLVMTAPVSLETDEHLWEVMRHDLLNAADIRWIGYLSTTGVYGDQQGRWIDETCPPAPMSERGEKRLMAEQAWQKLAQEKGCALDILRLTGIYGPGRNSLTSLKKGKARMIIKKDQVFNRIHVGDIARVTLRCSETATQGKQRIFNVSDGHPCPPQEVVEYAASLLGITPPPAVPYETAALSPMARSFYAENKRINNDKLRQELNIELEYPNYKAGLTALLNLEH